jgi:hypothetical protein
MPSRNGIYHARTNELEIHYTIDFAGTLYDYRRWQLNGIPCHHAIACSMYDIDTVVHNCYIIKTYKEAYA